MTAPAPGPAPAPRGPAGVVVWLTGLPGAGKTTLAARARDHLIAAGRTPVVLDGDAIRDVLGAAGHDDDARAAFYARLAALAAHLAAQGHVVLVPATAHRRAFRAAARALAPRWLEVWVATPADECARRDDKGLYARARTGLAPTLPGVGVPYEPPEAADVVAAGGHDEAAAAAIARRAVAAASA